jgi:hypothetical protein
MQMQHRLLWTDTFQVQHKSTNTDAALALVDRLLPGAAKSTKTTDAAQALVALTQQKLNI